MLTPTNSKARRKQDMPRNTQSQTQQKPSMPYDVEYKPMGSNTTRHFKAGNPKSTVDIAASVMRLGASNVTVKSWSNGDGWKEDATLLQRAIDRVQGVGNGEAVESLKQLGEYNSAMVRDTGKRNGADQELLASWLQQFFTTARSLGVTPRSIQQFYASAYEGYQEPAPQEQEATPAS